MQLRQASRRKTKLRVGLSGPSGSGKTYSALLMARGLTDSWDKVALIDTENGSGEMYSNLGDYLVLTLNPPYSPERYIEALKACEAASVEVIVIDSMTHEWDGEGGALQINEALAHAQFKGNTWAAWSKTTPRHQAFINKILGSNCHIITTVRAKTETIQADGGKIKKIGMKEIQRDGYEYELTLNFNIDRETHYATASKDRTGLFEGADPFIIDQKTGETLLKWASEGLQSFRDIISELTGMIDIADKPSDLTKVKEKLSESNLPADDEKAIVNLLRLKFAQFPPADTTPPETNETPKDVVTNPPKIETKSEEKKESTAQDVLKIINGKSPKKDVKK